MFPRRCALNTCGYGSIRSKPSWLAASGPCSRAALLPLDGTGRASRNEQASMIRRYVTGRSNNGFAASSSGHTST
jgi:hypothetical protein